MSYETLLLFVCEHIKRNEKLILHFSGVIVGTHTIQFQIEPYDIVIMQIHHDNVFLVEVLE